MAEREAGTVSTIDASNQWGFITSSHGLQRFFHRRALRPNADRRDGSRMRVMPAEGTAVNYSIARVDGRNAKGRRMRDQAIDIEVL